LGNSDNQRAQRRQFHRPGSRRRLARRWQLDRVDIKIKEFAAKLRRGLGDLLSVGIGPDAEANTKRRWSLFHRNTPVPARLATRKRAFTIIEG
jgi:hypothetical protein